MNRCSDYEGTIPDFEFTVSNRKNFTIVGDKLLMDMPMDGYRCCFAFYPSTDDMYHLGNVFLQDYYAVYDLDSYKLGLGKAKEFTSSIGEVEPGDKGDENSIPGARQQVVANLMIFFACMVVVALVALWACKKRGRREPLRHRFPLVDEGANSTGSSAENLESEPDARPENLRFIERTEEERRRDGDCEDDATADPNDTVQAHEANRNDFRDA